MAIYEIKCSIIRGGTSKGIFVNGDDLPADVDRRDKLILGLFGSPDIRQIDGLGGADPLTSKLAVVTKSNKPGVDVEFEAAQIGIAEPIVNFGLMCGNTASGVGYFAISEGMIPPSEPVTTVNIFCRNNQKYITARIPVCNGYPVSEGECVIPGVMRPGAEELMEFTDPGGAVSGLLLPTGKPKDILEFDGKSITVSVVDSGTLYCFIPAEQCGIAGIELPATLDNNASFRAFIEKTRVHIADYINSVAKDGKRALDSRKIKIATISSPSGYETICGSTVSADDYDVAARVINTEKVHKAYAVTGAISLGSAAVIPGTVVNDKIGEIGNPAMVRIGHPGGIMDVKIKYADVAGACRITSAEVKRTARIIMKGVAYVSL